MLGPAFNNVGQNLDETRSSFDFLQASILFIANFSLPAVVQFWKQSQSFKK